MTTREERHVCHAEGCGVKVPPKMLFCLRHWKMTPKHLQAQVWATYVPGQENRMDPTDEYMRAAKAAIEAIAKKEGRR